MILSLPSFPHVFSGGSTVLTTGEFGLDPIDLWEFRNLSGRFRFSLEKFEIMTSVHQCCPGAATLIRLIAPLIFFTSSAKRR
jgi:hypothetical protein